MLPGRRKLSLSKRIALIYSVVLFCILTIFSLLVAYVIRSIVIETSESEFNSAAEMIGEYMQTHHEFLPQELEKINVGLNLIYNIYSADGTLRYTNKPGYPTLEIPPVVRPMQIREYLANHEIPVIYINKPAEMDGKQYYIQVAKSIGNMGKYTPIVFRIMMDTSLMGFGVCLLTGLFLSRNVLKPIRNISNTARALTSKSLNKRIPLDGPEDELKDLARVFNSMLERLETDFEKQRRFVYDASHELRTPLSIIYGNINMLNRWGKDNPEVLARALSTLKQETENMNKLIADLLYLARGDSSTTVLHKENFLVETLLQEVVDETLLVHPDFNVTYSCDSRHLLHADYDAVKQVLRILLDNSIKFSSPPGDIQIEAAAANNGMLLKVADRGCGIPPDSLPYIFDRFYRVDESRTKATGGTGLGLSIAKQIVQNHDGTIRAESTLGEGTRITVFLPQHHTQAGS